MKRDEELTVITKTYHLILWSCNHTSRFPRNHRFVLGERIERNLYDLLELLIQASGRERPALARSAAEGATLARSASEGHFPLPRGPPLPLACASG